MSDWLHNLPIVWLALVVFGLTYLVAGGIFALITGLSKGERRTAFKAISPGMLPPLGIIFGLFVAFTAAQVWTDNERANAAVDREASALRAVTVLAATFPGETESHLRRAKDGTFSFLFKMQERNIPKRPRGQLYGQNNKIGARGGT